VTAEQPGTPPPEPGPELSDEELRARLEEELARITVRDVLVQTLVTLVNIGGHRLGVSESTKESADSEQVRLAIEAVRALLPVLEADADTAMQVRPVRDALAQLQLAYAQRFGADAPATAQPGESGEHPERGAQPQEPSRRARGGLWVPPGSN
jgi:hypothetical protein